MNVEVASDDEVMRGGANTGKKRLELVVSGEWLEGSMVAGKY